MFNRTQDELAKDRQPVGFRISASLARWRSPEHLGMHRPASFWSLALGIGLGLGLGVGALFGVGGIFGLGMCLVVLGAVCWFAKDAEPVLLRAESSYAPMKAPAVADVVPEPPLASTPPLAEPLDMVPVQGGTFLMGSPEADVDAYSDEKPQHTATVSDFCISRYPITRQLYREILGQSPAAWGEATDDERLPANPASWFEAVAFCNTLSVHVGLQPCYRIEGDHVEWDTSADGYRLPTEAEWEYACRAGTTSPWFFGDDRTALDGYAWFADNSGNRVHPVGGKEANPWGLHDMIGNVWEWCWDWHGTYRAETVRNPSGPQDGRYRARRGGSAWDGGPRDLRSARRDGGGPADRFDFVGFRCVRGPRRQS